MRSAVFERGEHRWRRHRDDGQVHRIGHCGHRGVGGQTLDLRRLGIDRIQWAVKAAFFQKVERATADLARVGRSTVDGNRARINKGARDGLALGGGIVLSPFLVLLVCDGLYTAASILPPCKRKETAAIQYP